ncbi:MAG: hypothetical protein DRG83_00240 [Deltaproteobacteria bacterium]|nr:MAG: hypothetical protein DRG83_00240 [Deltaproteobacteria bacterium]
MLYPEEVIAKSLVEDGWLDEQKAKLTAKKIITDLASYASLIPTEEGVIMIAFDESPPDWVEVVLVEDEDEKRGVA